VLAALLGYVLLQLLIGLWVARQVRSEDDYLLAGRRLGPGVAMMTIFATWFGAETCIGSAGRVYRDGLQATSADPLGYCGCLLLMGLVFAAALWRRGITTLPDLFERRYSAGVARLASLLIVPTSVFWAAAQVRAFGQVLAATTGIDVQTGLLVATGVTLIYVSFGGMLADVATDLVQGAVLIAGLAALGVALWLDGGGLQAVPERNLRWIGEGESVFAVVERWAGVVCGSVVAQELIGRVLASRSPGVARGACLAAAPVYLLVGLVPVAAGLVATTRSTAIADPEHVLPLLAGELLPAWLAFVFAGALVSAILSTVDSALLVAGSLTARNLLLAGRQVGDRTRLRLARACVVLAGVAAYFLARGGQDVYELVENASTFGSAGLFVLMLSALYVRRGSVPSAYAALLLGAGAWAWLRYGAQAEHPFLWSLAAAAAGYAAGSFVTRKEPSA
jgi:Na+/proline symporter